MIKKPIMKTLLLLFALTAATFLSSAQSCTPDLVIVSTGGGFLPDTVTNFPPALISCPYSTNINFKIPSTITDQIVAVLPLYAIFLGAPIQSFKITGVTGLPTGFNYACNISSCQYNGSSNGCVNIYGTSVAPAGSYPVSIEVELTVFVAKFGLGSLVSASSINGYSIELGPPTTTSVTACDYYTWNGQTYTQSGVYTGTIANCVTQALNLTITPSFTITQPASQSINISNNAQFIVGSSGSNAIYQWQTDLGIGFQNLNSVGQYSGTSNNTLTVSNITFSNNNQPFRCIVSSGSCTDTSDVAVLTVVNNVGFNDLSTSKLSIYPNPTNGDFTITGLELVGTVSSLSLTDMNGKVVKVLDTKATKFSMASIKPGVYFLNIISGNKEEVLKIVKE